MPIARALTWTCFAFVVSWQTSMPWIHACPITSSIVYRWRGSGSSIFRMRLRHARGLRLLIVGGHDDAVLVLNQQAKAKMTAEVTLKIVPRATHLFEEPGALAQVADFAAAWFWQSLKPSASAGE